MDSAIATLLCNGVVNPHSMGVGGGFFMTIYIEEEKKAYTLDAREAAPAYAHQDMFKDDPTGSRDGNH